MWLERFADRDLFMHHRGGGIGHTTGHNAEKANYVPALPELQSSSAPENNETAYPMDGDLQIVEELVQEVETHGDEDGSYGREDDYGLENVVEEDEDEESGSDDDGGVSEDEINRIGNFD